MSLTLANPTTSNGLDNLVSQLEKGGLFSLVGGWRIWFAAAAEQLETDDSIESRLTDEMADCLAEAEEALTGGVSCQPALNRLISLYRSNQNSLPLELQWRRRAAGLGTVQLESATWSDLHLALDAAEAGRTAPVARWIDAVEQSFLSRWESYEESDVLEHEITTESVVCHRLLLEGTELWLEALATFRELLAGDADRTAVLELAEAGQRLLILVQLLDQEVDQAMADLFCWARN